MRHRRGAADRILSNITPPGNPFEPGAAVRADARALSAAYGCPLRCASCGAASARRTINARHSTPRFFRRCHKCAVQFAGIRRRIAIGDFHVSSRIRPRAVLSTTVFLDAASADSGRAVATHEVSNVEARAEAEAGATGGLRCPRPSAPHRTGPRCPRAAIAMPTTTARICPRLRSRARCRIRRTARILVEIVHVIFTL